MLRQEKTKSGDSRIVTGHAAVGPKEIGAEGNRKASRARASEPDPLVPNRNRATDQARDENRWREEKQEPRRTERAPELSGTLKPTAREGPGETDPAVKPKIEQRGDEIGPEIGADVAEGPKTSDATRNTDLAAENP